jgi:ABC-2 type transport system permease protein
MLHACSTIKTSETVQNKLLHICCRFQFLCCRNNEECSVDAAVFTYSLFLLLYGLTLVWERDIGILKKLLVAPAPRYATIIGRSMSSGVRAIIQVVIIIPVALLLGVSFIPNPTYFVAALAILFIISGGFAALSIIVASLLKTRERFMGIGQALILPLFFASNALYPIASMPRAIQIVAVFNPLTYAVDAVRGLMITGNLVLLPLDVAVIALFDILMFAMASLSFRKIIE